MVLPAASEIPSNMGRKNSSYVNHEIKHTNETTVFT